ncbi:hypothetical protein P0136_05725 [Lentisphaerota bacterium ZTH]|nr:hypothetical protein JYG24_03165 [Lentisphaerota bacterium]WET07490.1 hypothetical protein P0136_05725 [Lentisphaerota bacterium ZTH]
MRKMKQISPTAMRKWNEEHPFDKDLLSKFLMGFQNIRTDCHRRCGAKPKKHTQHV